MEKNKAEGIREAIEGKRFCYAIVASSYDDHHGYIPVAVFEGVSGYFPMRGSGAGAVPWYWGHDLDTAERIAAEHNAAMGITPHDAGLIVASSMWPSRFKKGVRHE